MSQIHCLVLSLGSETQFPPLQGPCQFFFFLNRFYYPKQTFGKASILCSSSIKFTSRFLDFWIFQSITIYKYAITKFHKAWRLF